MHTDHTETKIHRSRAGRRTRIAVAFCLWLAAPVFATGEPATTAGPDAAAEPGAAGAGQGTAVPIDRAGIQAAIAEAEARRKALFRPEVAIPDAALREALAERWGVEVYGVRQATGGMMIDFRFRVLDAAKAEPLFDSRNKPYLVKDGSDVKLPVPMGAKVGAFRPTNRGRNIVADKDYYMMFANPGSYVLPGQKVSVVIGDFRVDGLALN